MVGLSNTYCWVILLSSLVAGSSAVVALVSHRYKDTLPETIALSLTAFSGFIVALQIGVKGYATGNGLAVLALSVAVLSVVNLWKQWSPSCGTR